MKGSSFSSSTEKYSSSKTKLSSKSATKLRSSRNYSNNICSCQAFAIARDTQTHTFHPRCLIYPISFQTSGLANYNSNHTDSLDNL